ncbi:MAG: SPASM domain-containing protein [Lachnospiraceae bacterium]|jgi:radical SAM protein with 4Fe4S-binding SPASM domain|nr:SPASM domain-containing protein [Lachnospiraceae bacterium]
MKVKASTYGGRLGWFLRKRFSALTSYAWIRMQFLLRRKPTVNYINNYQEGDNPLYVSIETINRCNSKCSFCPASIGNETRPFELMAEDLYAKILAELKAMDFRGVFSLFVSNEPLMDKRILDFHKLARAALPNCHILLFTNGTLLTLKKFRELAPLVDKIVVNNYSSSLKLHSNIQEILDYCQSNDVFPHLELLVQKRFIEEKLTNRANTAPNKQGGKAINEPCLYPFTDISIHPDGTVSLCCVDTFKKIVMGNCRENTLAEIWQSSKYAETREAMRKTRAANDVCKYCDVVDSGLRLEWIKLRDKEDTV